MATVRKSQTVADDVPVIGVAPAGSGTVGPVSGLLAGAAAKVNSRVYVGAICGASVNFYIPNSALEALDYPENVKVTIEAI